MGPEESRVKAIISKQLGKPIGQLENSKKFKDDLGADSLDTVSVLMALEDELGIEISDEAAAQIVTVQDAVDAYIRLVKKS